MLTIRSKYRYDSDRIGSFTFRYFTSGSLISCHSRGTFHKQGERREISLGRILNSPMSVRPGIPRIPITSPVRSFLWMSLNFILILSLSTHTRDHLFWVFDPWIILGKRGHHLKSRFSCTNIIKEKFGSRTTFIDNSSLE